MDTPNYSSNGHGQKTLTKEENRQQNMVKIWASVVGLLIITGIIGSIWYLLIPDTPTAQIRDVFVIGMAVELLLIGITLIVLLVQIAKLINLLQNEVKPLLETANETLATVRGTASFLSEAITEPVMKLNSVMAGIQRAIEMLNIFGK